MSPIAMICGIWGIGSALIVWWWNATTPSITTRLARVFDTHPELSLHPSTWKDIATYCAESVLSHLGSTRETVERRLRWAGKAISVEHFRLSQIAWIISCATFTALVALMGIIRGTGHPVTGIIAVIIAGIGGALCADYSLTRQAEKRQKELTRQLPDIAELLALAVSAGEAVSAAFARIASRSGGAMGEELRRVIVATTHGASLAGSLEKMAESNHCPPLTRFVDAVVMAMERGTPLAGVLADQAEDAREAARRELVVSGGKKEIAMLVPVVFLIMPITVVFAFYPGLVALRLGM